MNEKFKTAVPSGKVSSYFPSPSVIVPTAVLSLAQIFAPGIGAPFESFTVPETVICANNSAPNKNRARINASFFFFFFWLKLKS